MIPEFFRKSVSHRVLHATMEFLQDRDSAGPFFRGIVKSSGAVVVIDHAKRAASIRAMDRRRSLLEHRAADQFRDYFREERVHVAHAIGAGDGSLSVVSDALAEMRPDLGETHAGVWGDAAQRWRAWSEHHVVRMALRTPNRSESFPLVKAAIWFAKAKVDEFGAPIDDWLRRNAGKRITGITEVSRKKVAAQIAAGVEAGETIAAIKRRVDRFYLEDIIPNRSEVIALTEVGSAVNWAQNYVAEQTVEQGVRLEKEWFSQHDDRVRDDHVEADGQRVPMDEPFEVGGDLLMYPLDGSLGAGPEQIVRCRCGVLHHVVES